MKTNRKQSGFTLIELLVVIMIIVILGTVVGVQLAGKTYKAQEAAVTAQMQNFKTALQMYRLENGMLPTQEQGLIALCRMPVVDPIPGNYAEEGYLDSLEVPLDPWGCEYVYMIPGSHGEKYEIITYGKDQEPGGVGEEKDISSSDR
ncbi:type II secretion system major pseudopilin GspG [PVC group bacterium]|nr:type II secretion system major pseudopilin GspG [PVC group bacterium]